jgi:hypothetical protein
MLADAAKVFDGKLYIHGGGWNYLDILRAGASRPIVIAGRVLVPFNEEESIITLEIHLERREGGEILERAPVLQISMNAGEHSGMNRAVETATPFAFDIPGVVFLEAGEYAFVVNHDDEELARTRFQVNFPLEDSPDSTTES